MFKKFLSKSQRQPQGIPMRNPWLDIPHDHDPLPVMDGKAMCCGLCGIREPIDNLKQLKEKTMVKKKVEVKDADESVDQPQESKSNPRVNVEGKPEVAQQLEQVHDHVTVHEDRLDSGTNWKKSDQLPSLDD